MGKWYLIAVVLILLGFIISKGVAAGVTNNNPGNIEHGNDWIGESEICDNPRFECFDNPIYGVRAIAKVLLTYQEAHQLYSVRDLISRYAPSSENDTSYYVLYVSNRLNVLSDMPINLRDYDTLYKIVESIIIFETGYRYKSNILACGIISAGVYP